MNFTEYLENLWIVNEFLIFMLSIIFLIFWFLVKIKKFNFLLKVSSLLSLICIVQFVLCFVLNQGIWEIILKAVISFCFLALSIMLNDRIKKKRHIDDLFDKLSHTYNVDLSELNEIADDRLKADSNESALLIF